MPEKSKALPKVAENIQGVMLSWPHHALSAQALDWVKYYLIDQHSLSLCYDVK